MLSLSFIYVVVLVSAMSSYTYGYNSTAWYRFWWSTPGQRRPTSETDVLKSAYGKCKPDDLYCFQRLPPWAEED